MKDKPLPEGHFCWIDLATPDLNKAKKFYGPLLNWTFQDVPMGEKDVYSIARHEKGDTGALYRANEQMQSQSVPNHWQSYIKVESVDKTVEEWKKAKGTVIMGPFDVFDKGRMAVVKDPTGGVVSLWQAKQIRNFQSGQSGTLCWNELLTRDPEAAKKFYSQVFDWHYEEKGDYTVINNHDQGIGGIMAMPPQVPAVVPPFWNIYFAVDNYDNFAAAATKAGATTVCPVQDTPYGRFAAFRDNQGANFSAIQVRPH